MTDQMQPPAPEHFPAIVAVPGPLGMKVRAAHWMNYSKASRRSIQCVVVHCTDGCEGANKDDDVAAIFADAKLVKRRSCHYVVDADSATRCVQEDLTAWHCGKNGNALSVGVEICGRANQTRAEWYDAASFATLQIGARLVADICTRWHLPARVVSASDLRGGVTGITTHAMVSQAWKQSTHYDPGPGFPLDAFVAAVAAAMAAP